MDKLLQLNPLSGTKEECINTFRDLSKSKHLDQVLQNINQTRIKKRKCHNLLGYNNEGIGLFTDDDIILYKEKKNIYCFEKDKDLIEYLLREKRNPYTGNPISSQFITYLKREVENPELHRPISLREAINELFRKSSTNIFIGTSGYSFKWWFSKYLPIVGVSRFYPKQITEATAFKYYTTKLDFLELNATFYKLPTSKTVKKWYAQTPDNFRFLVKFSRFATHNKKLADFSTLFTEFWNDRVSHLKEKCIGILVQLGPVFIHSNRKSPLDKLTMLERVRKAGKYIQQQKDLPEEFHIYIEFRHTSWFCQEVYNMLKEIGWILVCSNLNNSWKAYGKSMRSGFTPFIKDYPVTVPGHIMFRCHGTWPLAYQGGYSAETLFEMYTKCINFTTAIVAFNNTDSEEEFGTFTDQKLIPHAILNAMQLESLFKNS